MKVCIRTPFAFAALFAVLAVGACSDDDPSGPNGEEPQDEVTVQMGDNVFTPREAHLNVGGTVTWVNGGERSHTTTSDDNLWDSDGMDTNETFDHTFPAAGTFEYVCTFHEGMTGTVIVE